MTHSSSTNSGRILTDREQAVLRAVVQRFIQTADPVGSRTLSKEFIPGLSAATIRNTMSDLEEWGYLDHPYTSAGRVPTDMGYRTYVDELMDVVQIPASEALFIREEIASSARDTERLLRETAKLMGKFTNLLAIALTPRLSKGILHRLDVVPLASDRAMFIISVEGGLVKTIVMEVASALNRFALDRVVQLLNERLSGLSLDEIRRTFAPRMRDLSESDPTGVVRLVMQKADVLFNELPEERRVQLSGTTHLMHQPEFREPEQIQRIMGLIEHEEVVVQLLERHAHLTRGGKEQIRITIGRENETEAVDSYSLVTANYKMQNAIGTISLIGPRRMDYARAVALIEYVSKLLGKL
ncbi:MAG: heat-inducible transcription repressor HrcA [Bacteroidetes Order II. Incertae sedis bacterium]|nr:heat-inducible transcription repressor HrcA [Bacteroidetes Order II. bacterium]